MEELAGERFAVGDRVAHRGRRDECGTVAVVLRDQDGGSLQIIRWDCAELTHPFDEHELEPCHCSPPPGSEERVVVPAPERPRASADSRLHASLRACARAIERVPTAHDFVSWRDWRRTQSSARHPAVEEYTERYGDWEAALAAAGVRDASQPSAADWPVSGAGTPAIS
jgi:hypothetical protein